MTGAELYKKLANTPLQLAMSPYTPEVCEAMATKINRINELKKAQNAVLLAHYYVPREIVIGAADFVGDSYKLSDDASQTTADTIVFAAVRFMAETAKILNPTKRVLVPGTDPACSLADSITADQVRELKAQYPEHTFVCYINTTAAVKALCDVCVTSSNVVDICERIPNDKIVFVPDALMGKNVINALAEKGIHKEIVLYERGACHVHERFDHEFIKLFKDNVPGTQVLAHPECEPDVVQQSDFVGSTAQIIKQVKTYDSSQNLLVLTECGLVSGLVNEFPQHRFVGACQMCQYMKSNSLDGILRVLENPTPQDEVQLDPEVMRQARRCIDAMFTYANQGS